MSEPEDGVEAQAMEVACRLLEEAGYARYEVASYARPGYESRHNTAYWTGVPYLGLGPSATSMRQNAEVRERVCDGEVTERLDAAEMLIEDLMLGMRMVRGVSCDEVVVADYAIEDLQRTFDELEELGLVVREGRRYRPTSLGWLCGNELYGRIYALG